MTTSPEANGPWDHYGESNDPETVLLETLSIIATLDPDKRPPLATLWKDLQRTDAKDKDDNYGELFSSSSSMMSSSSSSSSSDLWRSGSQLTARLIRKMTPFDVHLAVAQAMHFDQDYSSSATVAFCLLLCCWVLEQCPFPLEKRKKRWKSLLCETIQLFQHHSDPEWEVELWVEYLSPTCYNHIVYDRGGKTRTLVGIMSGTVGTSLQLMAQHPSEVSYLRKAVVVNADISEFDILNHPWQVLSFDMDNYNDMKLDFMMDLVWWTEHANQHDTLSFMDTSWSHVGMAYLAWDICKNGWSIPDHEPSWSLLFPHVAELLLESPQHGLELLEKTMTLHEEPHSQWKNIPINPIPVLQLLSNLLVSESQRTDSSIASSIHRSMQRLVQKFVSHAQVEIVMELIAHCPYPTLESKLLDLLRSIVVGNDEPSHLLWEVLNSNILMELKTNPIMNLLNKTEFYVSAFSIIQLHIMLHKRVPVGLDVDAFDLMLDRVDRQLIQWENSEDPPTDFHRMYLLRSTMIRVMEQIKGTLSCAQHSQKLATYSI